jgi:hypothetical protein
VELEYGAGYEDEYEDEEEFDIDDEIDRQPFEAQAERMPIAAEETYETEKTPDWNYAKEAEERFYLPEFDNAASNVAPETIQRMYKIMGCDFDESKQLWYAPDKATAEDTEKLIRETLEAARPARETTEIAKEPDADKSETLADFVKSNDDPVNDDFVKNHIIIAGIPNHGQTERSKEADVKQTENAMYFG